MSKSTIIRPFVPTQVDADKAGVPLAWFGVPARKATSGTLPRRWDARRILSEIVAGERRHASRNRRDARLDRLAGEAAWLDSMS